MQPVKTPSVPEVVQQGTDVINALGGISFQTQILALAALLIIFVLLFLVLAANIQRDGRNREKFYSENLARIENELRDVKAENGTLESVIDTEIKARRDAEEDAITWERAAASQQKSNAKLKKQVVAQFRKERAERQRLETSWNDRFGELLSELQRIAQQYLEMTERYTQMQQGVLQVVNQYRRVTRQRQIATQTATTLASRLEESKTKERLSSEEAQKLRQAIAQMKKDDAPP